MDGASIEKLAKPSGASSALRARLRDFYEDYAQCLDDDDLDGWAHFFTEDCHYKVLPRENYDAGLPVGLIYCMSKDMIRDRITALRETTMFQPRILRHFVSGVKINQMTETHIESQANFMITECLSDAEPILSIVGQYKDNIIKDNNQFQFRSRDCILDNYRIHTSLIMPV